MTGSIGGSQLQSLDPYLMMVDMSLGASQPSSGFPSHPHGGFEACTIVLEGTIEHRDSSGSKGSVEPGGVQWMTAGSGLVHSELPKASNGSFRGFQVWYNLAAKNKMMRPGYQDFTPKDIPIVHDEPGVSVRVILGHHAGVKSPVRSQQPGMILDVRIDSSQGKFETELPSSWNSLAYAYEGQGRICGQSAKTRQTIVLDCHKNKKLSTIKANSSSQSQFRFLILAGEPLNEPVVQAGGFVMNTYEQIKQAYKGLDTHKFDDDDDDHHHDLDM